MLYKLEMLVYGTNGIKKYQCIIECRNGKFIADSVYIFLNPSLASHNN